MKDDSDINRKRAYVSEAKMCLKMGENSQFYH